MGRIRKGVEFWFKIQKERDHLEDQKVDAWYNKMDLIVQEDWYGLH
jgi:hypothetical protein